MDLRPNCGSIRDQGQLGACTGFAITNAFWFDLIKQKLTSFEPSALFVYYNERVMEGTVQSDAGAAIRDGIKSIARQGVCPTSDWPYDIGQFAVQPSQQAYADALQNRALLYQRVPQNLMSMRACLASGYGFVAGIAVYTSFESQQVASTGVVPMPSLRESLLGGHAIFICGYDDSKQVFYVENSWGSNWGMGGFFTLPYAYLANQQLAGDFWVIKTVS